MEPVTDTIDERLAAAMGRQRARAVLSLLREAAQRDLTAHIRLALGVPLAPQATVLPMDIARQCRLEQEAWRSA